jgi:hypothetical protein
MAVNSSWHASINSSPAYLFTGRELVTPTRALLPKPATPVIKEGEYPAQLQHNMQYIWQKAREYLRLAKDSQKYYYDQKVVHSDLDVGDRVYKYSPRGRMGLSTKLVHHWIGPYIVTKVSETNACIRPVGQLHVEPKWVHLNMLKRYRGTNVIPEESGIFSASDSEPEDTRGENSPEVRDGDNSSEKGNIQGEQNVSDESEFPDLETDQRCKEREVEREEWLVEDKGYVLCCSLL